MGREEEIEKAVAGSKRPSTKTYIIVLAVAVIVFAGYFFITSSDTPLFSSKISSPSQAQETSGNINEGVQDVSSDMEEIGRILGE